MIPLFVVLCVLGALVALAFAFRVPKAEPDDNSLPDVSARHTAPPAPASLPRTPSARQLPHVRSRVSVALDQPIRPVDEDATFVATTAAMAGPEIGGILPTYYDGDVTSLMTSARDSDRPEGASGLRLTVAFKTSRGLKRDRHEDAFAAVREGVYVIADGAGGHAGGGVASRLAVASIEHLFRDNRFPAIEVRGDVPQGARELAAAIAGAHDAVRDRAASDPALKDMSTTILALRADVATRLVYVAHVGDSRCYRFRNGSLLQITRDHVTDERIDGKTRKVLSRALGVGGRANIDLSVGKMLTDDIYLLCTDGLYREVDAATMALEMKRATDLHDLAMALVTAAEKHGGRDNISVVLVGVQSSAPNGPASTLRPPPAS